MINIKVLEHKSSYMRQANKIANDVIREQILDIDTISNATFTSDIVLKAIEYVSTKQQ